MNSRPRSMTIIGWLFIAVGVITLLYGLHGPRDGAAQPSSETGAHHPFDHAYVPVVRIAAIVGGAGLLYGFNWARWLLVVWILGHVIIGFHDGFWPALIHIVLFGVVLYFLFRRPASEYLRSQAPKPAI